MSLSKLSDNELLTGFQNLIVDEREKLVHQLEFLIELSRRKLFLHYSSLSAYLVEEQGVEDWRAERLIRASNLLKRFPELKGKLESGKLNLTLQELGAGCGHREGLSGPELMDLYEAISGMSCKAAKRKIASRFPLTAELPHDRVRPLTSELSEVSFVIHQDTLDKLDEVRFIIAHSHPGIKMGELVDLLATSYLERFHREEKAKRAQERKEKRESHQQAHPVPEPKKAESPAAPRVSESHFEALGEKEKAEKRKPSQALVHELIRTQGYQCSHLDKTTGKQCSSRYALEIHHTQPWSTGGKTQLDSCVFLCFFHHKRASFLEFGESSIYCLSKGDQKTSLDGT
jgi:hypothetical protein